MGEDAGMEVLSSRAPRRRLGSACAVLCLLLAGCSSSPSGSADSGRSSTGTSTTAAATSAAGRPAADPEAAVAAALEDLDRRAQVAQLFLVGVPLDDLDSGESLVRSGVGGIFLAGRSEAPAEDLAATTAQWQSLAPGPALWVAVDQEGGDVQTLKGPGFDRLPPAVDQGDLPADRLATLVDGLGAALQRAGVNLNLAPVVDVVPAGTERANAPIGFYGRQYGSTAEEVAAATGAVVDGLAAAGVTATLKHFPGLGRVAGNTDTTAGVTDTVTTAGDDQVAAFGALADSAAQPFVMASSATYTRIDPRNQAMFSRVVLTDVLRDQLGFDGVILSDDVGNAEAVHAVPPDQRALRFLSAGGTMVLTVEPSDVPTMIDAVLELTEKEPDFARTVDAAVRTALLAKAEAGLLPPE
jgi:beta-glucosidase-like glycosyl hydrolase